MPKTALPGLAGSFLGELNPDTFEAVLDKATLHEYGRGELIFEGPPQPRVGVLLEGKARAFLIGPDGRQLTVRYIRPRSTLSTSTSSIKQTAIEIDLEAVSPVTVIELDFKQVSGVQVNRPDLAAAIALETQRRLSDVYRAFAATVFGTVGERMAGHLLDCAQPEQDDGLVAPVTQLDLARALGTAREVVSRSLRQLQAEGVIEIKRGVITISDPQRLMARAGPWAVSSRPFTVDPTAGVDQSFDNVPQPVIAIDMTGEIVYANAAVTPTFGWEPKDLSGQPITVLLPASFGAASQMAFAGLADAAPGAIGLAGDFHGLRADGSEFPAEITMLPVTRAGSTVVFATVVDLTYQSVLRERVAAQSNASD